jgi:hypothetical protein
MQRTGDWMQTVTGRKFWPLDPRKSEVHGFDIAHALSNICRFGGHTRQFYSVAEHSVYVSHAIDPEHALWGLLHDAAEAYLGDIIRPIKPYIAMYKVREERVMRVIEQFYNLPPEPKEIVKRADNAVLATEGRQVFSDNMTQDWNLEEEPIPGLQIQFWSPSVARAEFMARLDELLLERLKRG